MNPQRTDVRPQRSTDQQNSKKILENTEKKPQNANAFMTSKLIKYERQGKPNNDFDIRKISQKPNHSKQLKRSKPANDTRNRSTSSRRIALIREHLERVNGQLIKRENAEGERAHEENSQLESCVPGKKEGNINARVEKPETRVVKQVFHVDYNTTREDEHVLGKDGLVSWDKKHALVKEKCLGSKKRNSSNEGYTLSDKGQNIQSNNERALLLRHVNNSTPTRGNKEVLLESSYEQEPVVITRKIRKRWSKDFATNFPDQNPEDKDAHSPKLEPKESITSGNCGIRQPLSKCDNIVRVFITGGIRKNDYFAHKAILELDPETGNCLTRGTMSTGRYNHGIAQLGNEIYLVGGNSGFFEQLRSVESYSPQHAQWAVKPSMRESRDEFSLVVCGGCLYAIGGHNGIQDLRNVEKFSPRDNSWSFVSPMRNYRAGACAVAVDDR